MAIVTTSNTPSKEVATLGGSTITTTSPNIVIVVDLPFPKLGLGILAPLLKIPKFLTAEAAKAVTWLVTNANDVLSHLTDIINVLVTAIPTVSVNLVVRVGDIVVLDLKFVAKKVPFDIFNPIDITLPGAKFYLTVPLPSFSAAKTIEVPVPVPKLTLPVVITPPQLDVAFGFTEGGSPTVNSQVKTFGAATETTSPSNLTI